MHTYIVKIRIDNRVTNVTVSARDTSQAKEQVRAMYGSSATVLLANRVD